MREHRTEEIPCVDIQRNTGKLIFKAESVERAGRSIEEFGLMAVATPDVEAILSSSYRLAQRFFRLPQEVKNRYDRPDIRRERGYLPPHMEMGVACSRMGSDRKGIPDAKEACMMGIDPEDEGLLERYPNRYHRNIWPTETPGLERAMWQLFTPLFEGVKVGLQLMSLYLGMKEDELLNMVHDGPTIMRIIRYPGLKQEDVGKTVYACKHEDLGILTGLARAHYLGTSDDIPDSKKSHLLIRKRNGEWIRPIVPPGYSLMQAGKTMGHLTRGALLPTIHEVAAPEEPSQIERYSAALFAHVHPECILGSESDPKYPLIQANDFVENHLGRVNLGENISLAQ